MAKLIAVLETLGLTWLTPFARLAAGEDPTRQFQQILRLIGGPIAAFLVFMILWSVASSRLTTSIGAVPGPLAVGQQARVLLEQHREERRKADEFYARQAERKAKVLAQFPDKEWKERKYSGPPTFVDQIVTSLKTVFVGFLLASLVAVPLGIVSGASPSIHAAINPLVQIFKPVSPLAWLPLVMILVSALYTSEDPLLPKSFVSSAITVALCSLWPTLINTAVGVASIDQDYLNVASVLRLNWRQRLFKIVLPFSLPYIFTGLRLSLGVGWMVLIAAEMLAQNPGLGKFVWDMFQNGSSQTLALIMVAVFTIGLIGFLLDRIMIALQRMVSYDGSAIR